MSVRVSAGFTSGHLALSARKEGAHEEYLSVPRARLYVRQPLCHTADCYRCDTEVADYISFCSETPPAEFPVSLERRIDQLVACLQARRCLLVLDNLVTLLLFTSNQRREQSKAKGLEYIFLSIAFLMHGFAQYIFFASTLYLFGDHISPRSQLYW